jgi:hypothetical protein
MVYFGRQFLAALVIAACAMLGLADSGENRNNLKKALHQNASTYTAYEVYLGLYQAVGVDRMQRNFEPMRKQVETWKGTRLPDESAKLVIYRAFVEGELDVPKHLTRHVHDLYFNPQIEEFAPRTTWSLSNAFTSAFKELDPIPQFKATAKLASFLELATGTPN